MKINKIIIVGVFFWWFAYLLPVNFAYGEEKKQVILLEEFIREACRKDTNFEEILIDELKLKYERAIELPAKDIVLSVESQHNFLFDPKGGDIENTVSLSKLFPYAGTDIEAEYSSSLSRTTRNVSSDFTVKITQPIAENAFGRNTRLLDKITGIEIDVARHQIVEAYEDYLASLIQLYYDWYSAYEDFNTAQVSYSENLKLLENVKERRKNNIALPIDVNKSNLQVLDKKESLISLEQKYSEYLNLIKEAIRYEGSDELIPQDSLLYADTNIIFDKDYEKFSEESRTAVVLKLLEEKSSVEVDKYADELLPSIDIFAGYTLEGSNHDLEKGDRTVLVGATVDWPFPSQVERGEYETSKIDLEKTKLSSENIHVKLYTQLDNLNNEIERGKRMIAIAKEKIELSQLILDDEEENYSLGRSSLNDLIDEINKLETNKFNKISREIQLKKLIIEWLRLTDSLVAEDVFAANKEG
jgi:outer membrane protein TolC